jgi:hypothetical protein
MRAGSGRPADRQRWPDFFSEIQPLIVRRHITIKDSAGSHFSACTMPQGAAYVGNGTRGTLPRPSQGKPDMRYDLSNYTDSELSALLADTIDQNELIFASAKFGKSGKLSKKDQAQVAHNEGLLFYIFAEQGNR